MSAAALSFGALTALAPRLGTADVPCPACGPGRRSPANRVRKVLRIWRPDSRFISFHCARCGESGWAADGSVGQGDGGPVRTRVAKEMAEHDRQAAAERIAKARALWRMRQPIAGTIAERYLREVRAYHGPLPETVGFLPTRGDYAPAMVAAFGIADETESGVLAIADDAVRGIHLTKLRPDGLGKAGDPAKIMIGRPSGSPIVLAPPNDLLGLAITEGIEDALSIHAATGLGAWAAGSASHLPALADAVPAWVDAITVVADADPAGQAGAAELARRLQARGLHVEAGTLPEMRRAA